MAAVIAGLCDGTIDAVATDHAPHAPESKDLPFDAGAAGHARPADRAAHRLGGALAALSARRIFALAERAARRHRQADGDRPRVGGHSAQGGPVEPGATANLCVFDPSRRAPWWIRRALASRSRNTPYAGRTFSGAVRHTVLRGEPVVIDATAQR